MSATAAAPSIRPRDFLDVDHLLSDEERLIRDTVRQFVQDRVVPNVGTWFEEATIPRELPAELGKLGLLGMHLEGYGCAGASATAYGLACLELEAGDSGVRPPALLPRPPAPVRHHPAGSAGEKTAWVPAPPARGGARGPRPCHAPQRAGPPPH